MCALLLNGVSQAAAAVAGTWGAGVHDESQATGVWAAPLEPGDVLQRLQDAKRRRRRHRTDDGHDTHDMTGLTSAANGGEHGPSVTVPRSFRLPRPARPERSGTSVRLRWGGRPARSPARLVGRC